MWNQPDNNGRRKERFISFLQIEMDNMQEKGSKGRIIFYPSSSELDDRQAVLVSENGRIGLLSEISPSPDAGPEGHTCCLSFPDYSSFYMSYFDCSRAWHSIDSSPMVSSELFDMSFFLCLCLWAFSGFLLRDSRLRIPLS